MNIKELDHDTLLSVYEAYCPLYFPQGELKPLSTVEWLTQKGIYRAYGFYREEHLEAFAYVIGIGGQDAVLLDYYAVLEEFRGGGTGSDCLRLLAGFLREDSKSCRGIYIESEHPDFAADTADLTLRTRRVGFYERGGAFRTGLSSRLFGVTYVILYLPCLDGEAAPAQEADIARHERRLDAVYHEMFPQKYYDSQVCIGRA